MFQKTKVGDIASIKGGKRLPKGEELTVVPNSHPYIRAQDIGGGRVDIAEPRFVPDDVFQRISNYTVRTGDILITVAGNIGDVGIIDESLNGASLTENAVKLAPLSKDCWPMFLNYCLLTDYSRSQMQLFAAGAAQPKLGIYKVKEIETYLPPLPTQKKIASILSAYDDLIENNEQRIKILEETAKSIYREWFVKFRFPGHEDVWMVDSELGPIPEGWKVVQLGDATTINRGKSYRSSEISDHDGVSFINLKCVGRDGGFRDEGIRKYVGDYKDGHVVNGGDVVMAVTDMTQERRIVGRVARIPTFGFDGSVISMDLVRIQPNRNINLDFLYSLLKYSRFPDEIKEFANGTNVLHLSANKISENRLVIPTTAIQDSYSGVAGALFHLMDVLTEENKTLRQTRDLLLPKLISGELDVEDLDIAVA